MSTNSQTHIAHVTAVLTISVEGQSTFTQYSNVYPKYVANFGTQFVLVSTCIHLAHLTSYSAYYAAYSSRYRSL
jgi:hypothetical protein